MNRKIRLHHITFTGPNTPAVGLDFDGQPTFVYGASNTGKSFALKAINFLLGSRPKELPNIDERAPYDTAWLGLTLPEHGDVLLSRATRGGSCLLSSGLIIPGDDQASSGRSLSERHAEDDPNSLSSYLLHQIGFGNKRIAKNAAGQTVSLSFRNLIRYCLVDETAIQAPRTPIAGDRPDDQLDRSIFRMLLTGQDDSAIEARLTPPQFRVSKQARLATIDDLIVDLDRQIGDAQSQFDAQPDAVPLDEELDAIRHEIELARASMRDLVDARATTAQGITDNTTRKMNVRDHLARFRELERLYTSDIERLEAIEEAGFLLNLGGDRDCPLCGASPADQNTSHGADQVEALRSAALAEIQKIESLRNGLTPTIEDLTTELASLIDQGTELSQNLTLIEEELARISEQLSGGDTALQQSLSRRDVNFALSRLRDQRASLLTRREEYENQKQSRKDKVELSTPDKAIHELCQIISAILTEWQFPGERHVAFDLSAFDLRIDGKLRTDNGKGVRALTHTAFKLGVMIYCHERDLPHPGFLVLDSPLLTYRDAVRQPRYGVLEPDERALAQTPVREKFFEHLATLEDVGQIIVFDNIDPPRTATQFADPILFSGSSDGRYGFFPVSGD